MNVLRMVELLSSFKADDSFMLKSSSIVDKETLSTAMDLNFARDIRGPSGSSYHIVYQSTVAGRLWLKKNIVAPN